MSTVSLTDIDMYYVVYRDGKVCDEVDHHAPTMIVWHGGPGFIDHQLEVPYWKRFSDDYQVIFPDQRGCGKSGGYDLPDSWNLPQCGDDNFQFVQRLELDIPPIAVGISWGGYTNIAAITSHPDYLAGLILCNTEAHVSPENRRDAYIMIGEQRQQTTTDSNEQAAIAAAAKKASETSYQYDTTPTEAGAARYGEDCFPFFSTTPFTAVPPEKENWPMRTKFMQDENTVFDYRTALDQIICPVLYLAGDLDPVHPAATALDTAQYFPQDQLNFHIISGAGAPVYQDRPEQTEKYVRDFISNVLA